MKIAAERLLLNRSNIKTFKRTNKKEEL